MRYYVGAEEPKVGSLDHAEVAVAENEGRLGYKIWWREVATCRTDVSTNKKDSLMQELLSTHPDLQVRINIP